MCEPPPTKSTADAYVLFFVSMLLVLTAGVITQSLSIYFGLAFTETVLILLPALVYTWLKKLSIREALRLRPIVPALAIRSIILGVFCWGLVIGLYALTEPLVEILLGPAPDFDVYGLLPRSVAELVVVLIVGAVIPGVCEEILFRGALQGTLEKKGVSKGILYVSFLFAAFHLNPWLFLPIIPVGLVAGIMTVRTNSILPAIVLHVFINVTQFSIEFACGATISSHLYPLAGVFTVLFLFAFLEFLHRTRSQQRQPSPLAAAPAGISCHFMRIATGVLLAVCVLVIIFVCVFIKGFTMKSDALSPEINPGDKVLVLGQCFFDLRLKPGDIVAIRGVGHVNLRKVKRVDGQSIWIAEGDEKNGTESLISPANVIGKMIWKFSVTKPPPAEQ